MAKDLNFYQVYRELFKRIDKEEEQEENVGTDHVEAPSFGDADTYFEDVLAFYRYWEVFGTLKTFAYSDEYDTSKAQNTREKRYMKNDNKKERQKERVRFNQTIRELLEFVRKRDPRYQSYIKAKEEEKERKKAADLEMKRKKEMERDRIMEEYREKLRKEHEDMEEEDEEEVEEHQIMCQICAKSFKTEGAFTTH